MNGSFSNRTVLMADAAAVFESEVQRQILRILAEVQRLLEITEATSDASGTLARRIEEMCDRWTEVERVRNLIHARVAAGSEWRHLRGVAEAALRDLWRSVLNADTCLRSLAIWRRQYAMPLPQLGSREHAREDGECVVFRAHHPGVA